GTNLTEINIPATLRYLSKYAFDGSTFLVQYRNAQGVVYYDGCLISFPDDWIGPYYVEDGTRLIASHAFAEVQRLTQLYLPESVQCICEGAINYSPLLQIVSLPSSIQYIGPGFLNSYCSMLKTIYCYSETPYYFESDDYFQYWKPEDQALINLYVPAGSRAAYQAADKWKDFVILEMQPIYTVTFVDYDGREISVQRVEEGKDAMWPSEEPKRDGYNFTGWDKEFTNVQSDLTITAQYELKTFSVLFLDGNTDGVIDSQNIPYGGSATEPEVIEHDGYVFIGWDKEFDVITENTVVTAQYMEGDGIVSQVFDAGTRTVTFYYDNKLVKRPGIMEIYTPTTNRYTGYDNKVLKVVIDPSMKDANLTSTRLMFSGGISSGANILKNLASIEGLENLNTENVTDMSHMFAQCQSLTSLDLSSFDTGNVTNMNYMFTGCNKLQMLDLSSFDISKVTDMRYMFASCPQLKTICCFGDWSGTSALTNNMFYNCKALVGGRGTPFNSNFTDKRYARPDGGTASPGYFTAGVVGDVNGDGEVNLADAQTILGLMAKDEYKTNADVNNDSSVDLADYQT
ncbi:MAG: BspA family leucine-rich repeat surface protein, partial [Bacteroidaceae bacterium]|nr:BspA family leucine-rich repeat surface protein [Bacteroidaceae bacterium]